jgi:hypothetical protein
MGIGYSEHRYLCHEKKLKRWLGTHTRVKKRYIKRIGLSTAQTM